MTNADIVAEIQNSPALMALVPDTVALADAMSVDRTKLGPYEAGKGDILNTLGFEAGNPLCDLIDSEPSFRHVKHLLSAGRLRVDLPLTVASLQALVGTPLSPPDLYFTQEHANKLIDLARVPDPITEYQVRCAIFNDDGSLRV
jgi:hypothetical protein